MVIPQCSVCKIAPDGFPVCICETCFGKTIVCQSCAINLRHNPSNPHKNHRLRIWGEGLWFDMSHVFFKSLDPPTDQFGPQWRVEGLEQLVLGHNVLTNNVQVLSFFPRPSGNLRLALVNAPPGQWEVALQIATWPSSAFGENQLKLLYEEAQCPSRYYGCGYS